MGPASAADPADVPVRFAIFDASLNRGEAGALIADLRRAHDAQAQSVAAIIQRVDAGILLLNEFDAAAGRDLDPDGSVGGQNDACGFGRFSGRYGMALLSKWPMPMRQARIFRSFLQRDVPGSAGTRGFGHPGAAEPVFGKGFQ